MTFPILGGNGAVTGAFSIDNSLRFNDDDSAKLSRTPSSSGNRKTWTWSAWVKRGNIGSGYQNVFSQTGGGSTSQRAYILLSDDLLVFAQFDGGSVNYNFVSNQVLRDVSAFYHIVVAVDTTQATSSNRVKIYINGTQVTSFSSETYPSQNLDTYVNNTEEVGIGFDTKVSSRFFDGYLAEVHLIDGTAKSPTDFGEFDEDSGIWKPIEYSGSYGTNGFYLDFENSGSLGADSSGNGNNFTPTNLASTDQTTDTPTNNFATMNPLRMSTTDYLSGGATQGTFSEGNLKVVGASGGTGSGQYMNESATFTMDKFYAEARVETNNGSQIGVMDETYFGGSFGALNGSGTVCLSGSNISKNGSNVYALDSYSAGDIIGVAMNHTSQKVWIAINNVWQGSGTQNPATGDGGYSTSDVGTNMFFAMGDGGSSASGGIANFGQEGSFAGNKTAQGNADGNGYGDFYYAPPSGYLALCTQNLATELSPTIDNGSEYFNTVLWTGNGADDRSITGVGFQPDAVWYKERNSAVSHRWVDAVRGSTKLLFPNNSDAEFTDANELQAFESDGFQVGTDLSINGNGDTYVAWNWLGSNTTASNTDGSITSTVSANTTAGFSIVSYTGTGANATVGHGLGKPNILALVKNRDLGRQWLVRHPALASNQALRLDVTGGVLTRTTDWNDTLPTSTVLHLGNEPGVNGSGDNMIAYCFAEIEGYSKFGSYTSNGNIDGPFVYTGFKPSFIIMKASNQTAEWVLQDTARDPVNPVNNRLIPNDSIAEYTNTSCLTDFVSNGFKMRSNHPSNNFSGYDFIYMAFAENPFVSSSGVPVTAR